MDLGSRTTTDFGMEQEMEVGPVTAGIEGNDTKLLGTVIQF